MALLAVGTDTTSSLSGLTFIGGMSGMNNVDQAALCNGIKDDKNVAHPRWPGAFSSNGILYVPNRGELMILPGDVVAIDDQGWPILISAYSVANGPWTVA